MTDRIYTADASKVSGADFFRYVFGSREQREQKRAELESALKDHIAAIQATYTSGAKLWDEITARDELKVEYRARVEEIEARGYAERADLDPKELPDGRHQVAA